jgi:hypothetical protein
MAILIQGDSCFAVASDAHACRCNISGKILRDIGGAGVCLSFSYSVCSVCSACREFLLIFSQQTAPAFQAPGLLDGTLLFYSYTFRSHDYAFLLGGRRYAFA